MIIVLLFFKRRKKVANSAHTNGMNKKTYYGKLKRRGLKIADGAGKTLASPATDPSGSYTGIVTTSGYDVPEQDVDDL